MNVPYIVTWETSNRNDRGREIGVSEDDNFVATVLTDVFPIETRWIVVISYHFCCSVTHPCDKPFLDGQWPWGSGARYVVAHTLLSARRAASRRLHCTETDSKCSHKFPLGFFTMSASFWQVSRAGLIRRQSDTHAEAARSAFPFFPAAKTRTASGCAKAKVNEQPVFFSPFFFSSRRYVRANVKGFCKSRYVYMLKNNAEAFVL